MQVSPFPQVPCNRAVTVLVEPSADFGVLASSVRASLMEEQYKRCAFGKIAEVLLSVDGHAVRRCCHQRSACLHVRRLLARCQDNSERKNDCSFAAHSRKMRQVSRDFVMK